MNTVPSLRRPRVLAIAVLAVALIAPAFAKFHVEEATIADIQKAILAKEVTATEVVKLYLARIKAYNGPAVAEPYGILGPVKTVPHAKGINALSTLNLRPAARKARRHAHQPCVGCAWIDERQADLSHTKGGLRAGDEALNLQRPAREGRIRAHQERT